MALNSSTANFESYGKASTTQHSELTHFVSKDPTLPSAYLRVVAAIASSDGVLNIADFNALSDVALLLNDSALARVVLLENVEHPLPLKVALQDLERVSTGIDQSTAAAFFEGARGLLAVQGTRSRELAKSLANASRYQFRKNELEAFAADEQTIWSKVSTGSVRMLKGRKYAELADLCVRATGDLALAGAVLEFEQGSLDKAELTQRMTAACARAAQEISAFNERIAEIERTRDTSVAFLQSAYAL